MLGRRKKSTRARYCSGDRKGSLQWLWQLWLPSVLAVVVMRVLVEAIPVLGARAELVRGASPNTFVEEVAPAPAAATYLLCQSLNIAQEEHCVHALCPRCVELQSDGYTAPTRCSSVGFACYLQPLINFGANLLPYPFLGHDLM